MSGIRLSFTVAALAASLTCGLALAQTPPPAAKQAPAPKPAVTAPAAAEPSTATKVESWTVKEWNAAKGKWSKDKAKWTACSQEAKDQKLSGRKSWSYLYGCMTKA
jgi:hypothetical protein